MWQAVIVFLLVQPSYAQGLVPGPTVFGKQLVDQQLILCTKRSLSTTLLLRSHEVSLIQMPCNPLPDDCGEGFIEDRQTRDRPVILGLVSLVILRNQSSYSLRQPVGYRVWILNQQVVVTSQISVKTRDTLDPETINLVWTRRLPVPHPFETRCDLIV